MKIKNIFNKFLSAFCAALISFVSLHPVLTVSVFAAGAGAVIGSVLEFADFSCHVIDIVSSVYTETPGGLNQAKYLCAWMDFIKQSGISEDDFKTYYEEIITRSEEWAIGSDEYNTYLFIQDTSANGVSLDSICYMAYHDSGLDDFTVVENDDGNTDLVVSGKGLKDMVADYNSRYIPMPVQDSYLWSYQSSTTSKRLPRNTSDYLKSFQFEPYVPVYSLSSGTWGGKGWGGSKDAGVYILPFWYDDNNSHGVYYHEYYAHIYCIPATSDSAAKLCLDVYNLSDGSLFNSYSCDWNSDYTHYAFNLDSYFNCYGYKSNSDYQSNLNNWCCLFSSSLSDFIASDYSSGTFYSMIVSSSFTPDSDKDDDWGYYVQNKPFELFANQTQVDFNQIPDNYVITINGDTIYDYSITNPDTGDTTTINNYITNNYIIPSNPGSDDDPDDPGTGGGVGGGSVSGDITVGGKVDVNGEISIKTDPIDINFNLNGVVGSGSVEAVQFDQDVSLNNYYDWMNEQTSGFGGFMSQFFSWLPVDIVMMLCAGFACVILMRFLGR